MKKLLYILIIFAISGCGPSKAEIDKQIEEAIQKTNVVGMVAETQSAPTKTEVPTKRPTRTKGPTKTPSPTKTSRPTATATVTRSPEEFKQEMSAAVIKLLEAFEDIETVNMVRYADDGSLEIEVKTVWASQDRQMDVHYLIVQVMADAFAKYDEAKMNELSGGNRFGIALTSLSTDGDYRLQSYTEYAVLVLIDYKAITMEEWQTMAGASFR